ncbi:MAG: hypothetical protein AAGK22_20870 [Acidobacteriota bacterium]
MKPLVEDAHESATVDDAENQLGRRWIDVEHGRLLVVVAGAIDGQRASRR